MNAIVFLLAIVVRIYAPGYMPRKGLTEEGRPT